MTAIDFTNIEMSWVMNPNFIDWFLEFQETVGPTLYFPVHYQFLENVLRECDALTDVWLDSVFKGQPDIRKEILLRPVADLRLVSQNTRQSVFQLSRTSRNIYELTWFFVLLFTPPSADNIPFIRSDGRRRHFIELQQKTFDTLLLSTPVDETSFGIWHMSPLSDYTSWGAPNWNASMLHKLLEAVFPTDFSYYEFYNNFSNLYLSPLDYEWDVFLRHHTAPDFSRLQQLFIKFILDMNRLFPSLNYPGGLK